MIDSTASATPNHWDNLVWALKCPDITPEASLPWLPESRLSPLWQYFSDPQTRTRLEPQLLLQLQQLQNHRLGAYFESLWKFIFDHHPDYVLLAHNLPIRDHGKTLGELDFVVRHIPDSAVEHWEVAVKFYLHVDDYWVGPGLRDRLDIKLARMAEHQLPIVDTETAQAVLRESGIKLDRQWTRVPGRLFTALDSTVLKSNATSDADNFWWADTERFCTAFSSRDWRWLQLPKQAWLAPCNALPDRPAGLQPEHFQGMLSDRGPICVAAMAGGTEVSRGFIVPDDWHARALQAI
ncbi:DUF1853 family protein [Microbulbifer hydrolyticus]|uniref:DUF1853 family protein n=1 Tax=Microbulbifer hydrolyticus TaxID=48074 RepID=A0A6P1TAC0_9GAMM|nr:DUF1853 family protein [Microbulbifer hydrolyticus]MBB5210978.1 hypothetical protein [Microbulbifer hydrolyticus]QHQ38209.1 DUF1853 family protein [Microbulbifer hydrolyticus]